MNEVLEFFRNLGDTSDWPPRWHCGRWSDFHGWLYIGSDLLIWSAYFTIPLLIVRYISRKRREGVRFQPVYLLFASFILACGATHFVDALLFWLPAYRISALMRLATGVISWVTVIALLRMLPTAFALKPPHLLEREIRLRTEAEARLQERHQRMVAAETAAGLCHWTWDVQADRFEWSESAGPIFHLGDTADMNCDQFLGNVHPKDREAVRNRLQDGLQRGQLPDFEFRLLLSDLRLRDVHLHASVVTGADGSRQLVAGTLQDVTDHRSQTRQIEAQNRRLRTIAALQSHHVRGPLATILGLTQVIERTGGPNDELLAGLQEKARELDVVVQRLVRATKLRTADQ